MAKAKKDSSPVSFAFSTSGLTAEIRKTTQLAQHVKASLHASATPVERQRLDAIIQALNGVRQAALGVYCPNPYYGFYTVDQDAIKAWPPGTKKMGKKAKGKK